MIRIKTTIKIKNTVKIKNTIKSKNTHTPSPPHTLLLALLLLVATPRAAHSQGSATAWDAISGSLRVTVRTDGTYAVLINGAQWLASGQTGLVNGGKWYSSPTGANPLTLVGTSQSSGSDALGSYYSFQQTWSAAGLPLLTVFRLYTNDSMLVFDQQFPNGATGTSWTNGISSAFPSFQTGAAQAPALRCLTFNGGFAAPSVVTGLGSLPIDAFYGLESNVPLALFDPNSPSLSTVLLSPLNNFKAGVQTLQNQSGGQLSCGIQGQVSTIPAGFRHQTLLYAGSGINNSFYGWGARLLQYYGKDRSGLVNDFEANHLGYWTDRGAYYYYQTEPGQNYEQTMMDIRSYHQSAGLPFRSYQLDSWWYPKGSTGGVTQWDPLSNIFPDGIPFLHTMLGAPLTLHNRYWDPNTIYRAQYQFLVDTGAVCPMDPAFWPFLMQKVVDDGAGIYEQDWLQYELEHVHALQADVSSARQWLVSMGAAASQKGRYIQYCQALPADYLQSVEIPAVTQIRATGDYHFVSDNWRIGTNSMLAWAVGLAPFKDTFWTSVSQPGNPNGGATEPNPELQTLVSILSAGPVGPGDGIGYTDKNLLMKVCMQDGLLLKPDKPATPIDRCFLPNGPQGEVWDTYSNRTDAGQRWHYLPAISLAEDFTLLPGDLGISGPSVAYNYDTGAYSPFDNSHPLNLPASSPLSYYLIAPIEPGGWALLGEIGKFVTLSSQRFSSVSTDGLTITIKGTSAPAPQGIPDEVVQVAWLAPAPPLSVTSNGQPVSQAGSASANGWFYNPATHLFTITQPVPGATSVTFQVTPDSTASTSLFPPTSWQAIDLALGSDNKSHLLWTNTHDNSILLWTVNNSNVVESSRVYGPYSGWTATAIAVDSSGNTHLMMNNTNGQAALQVIAPDGSLPSGFAYGPYPGWTAVALAIDPAGSTHLLWRNTDGRMALWKISPSGAYTGSNAYGPYAGWTAISLAVDSGSLDHILWTNTDGRMALWTVNSSGAYTSSSGYGPYAGWNTRSLRIDSGNRSHILWTNGNGSGAFWTINPDNSFTSSNGYGPYPGWSPAAFALDTSSNLHLLWDHAGDSQVSLWSLSSGGVFQSGYNYMP